MICGLFPSIDVANDVVFMDGVRFKIRISQQAEIDFMPLESPHLHNSEIRLVFEESLISISEGMKIEIRKIETNSLVRKWPRELQLLYDGNFSDGFESSYLNQDWWRSSQQDTISEELSLDHLCNRIIETASGNNI
jgi:hypothetical protein